MTPHYIAVREDWSVQQVMDFVREHGQDSETLNVIYVVDEQRPASSTTSACANSSSCR